MHQFVISWIKMIIFPHELKYEKWSDGLINEWMIQEFSLIGVTNKKNKIFYPKIFLLKQKTLLY